MPQRGRWWRRGRHQRVSAGAIARRRGSGPTAALRRSTSRRDRRPSHPADPPKREPAPRDSVLGDSAVDRQGSWWETEARVFAGPPGAMRGAAAQRRRAGSPDPVGPGSQSTSLLSSTTIPRETPHVCQTHGRAVTAHRHPDEPTASLPASRGVAQVASAATNPATKLANAPNTDSGPLTTGDIGSRRPGSVGRVRSCNRTVGTCISSGDYT